VSDLQIDELEMGQVHRRRLVMAENATGNETLVPVIVVRGPKPGPVVGITAAVHGNELNGIRVIHRLLQVLGDKPLLQGTVVAAPIVNVPGYLRQQREFEDGTDINRIMPGKPDGNESSLYAHRVVERLVSHFDYLFDLHTASFGRINSLYVRVNMEAEVPRKLARLLDPQIIVHSPGADGTLRAAAANLGVHAVTVEVGDPQRFQPGLVRSTRLGLQEVLEHLGMLPDISDTGDDEIVECHRSYWIYTDRGGVLYVRPDVTERVEKGEVIAKLYNVWGDLVREYEAPEAGIIVGKSTNPAARAGSRIVHLGVIGKVA
jgi:predicted deacylase